MFFHIGAFALIFSTFWDTPKREWNCKIAITSLFGLCVFNLLMHGYDIVVMNGLLNISLFIISLYVIVTYCDNLKSYFKYIYIGIGINILILITQQFGMHFILDTHTQVLVGPPGGIMGNAPRLMAYINICLSLFPSLLFAPLLLLGLWIKEFSIVFIILFLMWFRNRRLTLLLIILFSIIGFLLRGEVITSIAQRVTLWKYIATGFFDKPLIGFGIDVCPYTFHDVNIDPNSVPMYNSYIEFVKGIGILGIAWLGYIFYWIYKSFHISRISLAFYSLLLLSLGEYPFEIERLWFTILFIIGGYVIESIERDKCQV